MKPVCVAPPCARDATAWWKAGSDVVHVDAPEAAEWDVSLSSPRCWSAPLRVTRERAAEPVRLHVWRAGEITGKLLLPERMPAGESVAMRIESVQPGVVPPTTIHCPIKERRFRCVIPAMPLDLRLAPEGVAPRYVWGVAARADATFDAGELRFGRGGAIVGMVRFSGDGPPVNEVRIELTPALAPPTLGGAEAAHRITRGETVQPNARGLFQFAQIEAGQYTVTAKVDGWSSAREPEIRVEEGRETRLSALTIEPLARVEVSLMPPLDPYGERWRVKLYQLTPIAGTAVEIAAGQALMTGQWSVGGVHGGAHLIAVADHRGNAFARSTVDVSPRMPPVLVTIDAVAIDGVVRMGDAPLAARLEFRNPNGAKATFRSDAEGRFSGALPAEGRWNVDVTGKNNMSVSQTTEVRRRDSGPVKVELELADTTIDVTVVGGDGKPVAARVRALDRDGRIIAAAPTDENGRVQLAGIDAEEEVRLSATSRPAGRASGAVAVRFDSQGRAETTLIVQSQIGVRGWLVTPAGKAVAGAFVRFLVPQRERYYNEEVSGPSGQFEITVPPDTAKLDLVILPPAMPVKMVSIPIDPDFDPNVEIVVGGPAATLEIETSTSPPFPIIRSGSMAVHTPMLRYPLNWSSPPRDWRNWGLAVTLEAGSYSVCSNTGANCKAVSLAPGAIERVDARGLLR